MEIGGMERYTQAESHGMECGGKGEARHTALAGGLPRLAASGVLQAVGGLCPHNV